MKRIILMSVLLMASLSSCSNSVVGRYDLISHKNNDISKYDYNYVELKADGTFIWKERWSDDGAESETSGVWTLNGVVLTLVVPGKPFPFSTSLVDGVLVIDNYTFSKKGKVKEKSKDSVTPVVSESNTEKKESVVAETEKVEEEVPIEVEDVVADSDAEGAQTYVIKNKTYFYEVSRPDVCNKTKAYLVPGDVVTIDPDPNLRIFGLVEATYTNAKGKTTEGWIYPEDVDGLE